MIYMVKVKKSGFTLVELLAVIVILAIVLAIAIPGISGIINSVKVNAYKSQMKLIEDATAKYMLEGFKYEDLKVGEMIPVTLQQLYDSNILSDVKNPSTKESLDPNSVIYVTKKRDDKIDYSYEYESDCRYNGKSCLKDNITSDLVGKSQTYQGGTYYKGTNATILNNYVWYSGQEYRVMGINSDGSIKMVTSLPVVSVSWGPTGTADYVNSYARKWLNILPAGHTLKDDYEGIFYKSLSRPDLIEDYPFCIGKQDPTSSTDTTCSTKLTDKVGLMTWWEYKIAGPNANGADSYLDIKNRLQFLTGDSRASTNVLSSEYTGSIYESDGTTYMSCSLNSSCSTASMRPVINLKSTTSILNGNGTSGDPYRLVGDESGNKNDNLNSRYAGEYLRFNGAKYRIVSKNSDGNIKILRNNYVPSTGTAGNSDTTYYDLGANATNICQASDSYTYCNNHFDITDGSGDYNGSNGHNIGYFLNSNASNSFYSTFSSTYKSYLVSDTYYFGKWSYGADYKLSYTNALTNGYGTQNLMVGMLTYGEMLAGSNENSTATAACFWLVSPQNNSSSLAEVDNFGYIISVPPSTTWIAVRPTLTLKSTVKIVSGSGTKADPYEIIN